MSKFHFLLYYSLIAEKEIDIYKNNLKEEIEKEKN